jgi:CO dehydrogenase/acetyl-CoA synthase epsilon subunit
MQKEALEILEQSNETVLEAVRKIAELNMRSFDKLFQQQADLAAFYMDAGARGMELITKAKGYQDLMAGQTALARELGERNMAALRTGMADVYATSSEYGNLFQEGIKLAQEQVAMVSGAAMKVAA